jgi:hypothetical protein
MIKYIFCLVLTTSTILFHSAAFSSLLTNGSFEQVNFDNDSDAIGLIHGHHLSSYHDKGRAWDVFMDLPGWTTILGNGIELQRNVVTNSHHEDHHVELDSHSRIGSNSVMNQSLYSLTIGADYLLTFYYKPRTNKKNDNKIKVFWYNDTTNFSPTMTASLVANSTKKLDRNWIEQSVILTADSTQMNLSFGAFGKENTLGGLIDNISLMKVNEISEPAVFTLFALFVSFILFRQHHRLNNRQLQFQLNQQLNGQIVKG